MSSTIPTFKLNNGYETPAIGYGTFQANDDELEKALEAALEAGYRHIDTATAYFNEKVIGRVLKRWIDAGKLKRGDLFIVTKLPLFGNRPSEVSKYLKQSLEDLQLDYIDLYLIHSPIGLKIGARLSPDVSSDLDMETDLVAIWAEMEKQVSSKLTRAIGLSNFNKSQVERILKNCKIRPSALQIELHVCLQQNDLVDFCKKNDILVTAYSPLGAPGVNILTSKLGFEIELPDILNNPTVKKIAKKHGKTEAQILLRYNVERGILGIPKSTNPKRLRENIDLFNFKLDAEDIAEMKGLNVNKRIFDLLCFKGIEKHPEYPFNE